MSIAEYSARTETESTRLGSGHESRIDSLISELSPRLVYSSLQIVEFRGFGFKIHNLETGLFKPTKKLLCASHINSLSIPVAVSQNINNKSYLVCLISGKNAF